MPEIFLPPFRIRATFAANYRWRFYYERFEGRRWVIYLSVKRFFGVKLLIDAANELVDFEGLTAIKTPVRYFY